MAATLTFTNDGSVATVTGYSAIGDGAIVIPADDGAGHDARSHDGTRLPDDGHDDGWLGRYVCERPDRVPESRTCNHGWSKRCLRCLCIGVKRQPAKYAGNAAKHDGIYVRKDARRTLRCTPCDDGRPSCFA